MQERDFEALLDRYGADLARWPDAALSSDARALLVRSLEARTMLDKACRLADLFDAAAMPPPQPTEALVERATAHPQMAARRKRISVADFSWLGLGRWHAVAFASCLVLGILLGVGSVSNSDSFYAVLDMVDSPQGGDFHE